MARTLAAGMAHLEGVLVLKGLPGSTTGSISLAWLVWLLSTCIGCAFFAQVLFKGEDKTVFMPGPLSNGHHQLAESCDSCHTDAFGGGPVLQESCESCHGDVRKKPFDSHPKAKFSDPRNADMLADLNATQCVTCHQEHKAEITLVNGVTQPEDFCYQCHESIAEDRPSHEGMGFETCANSGCHNFHDNRALYTDFLVKHLDQPAVLEAAGLPEREFADVLDMLIEYPRDQFPVETLALSDADAPDDKQQDATVMAQWQASGHAEQGVNCTACHTQLTSEGEADAEATDITAHWTDDPVAENCASCHDIEVEAFGKGKHGMRLAAGLSPMTVGAARLPMHEDAAHQELTCNSCHAAHDYDVVSAAVEACVGCHADDHTVAYRNSKHYALWLAETEGNGKPGTGVSCASCHMPRISQDVDDYNSRIVVDHNQSANLAPNSKMIRGACLECHGLGFSIDSLMDDQLVQDNFQGLPTTRNDSLPMARELMESHEKRKNGQ